MIINAYSIYDRKALVYHAPFFTTTDPAAARHFGDLANDTGTTIGRHPGDYVLYRVGTFDDQRGLLLVDGPIVHIVDASACLKAEAAALFPESSTGL